MTPLQLTSRYYRTIPINDMGYETEIVELDPARTALVVLHCWDIGCEGGPAIDPNYYVGMGTLESNREAARMMRECIRPAMDAARKAGLLVAHVEAETIAPRYPQSRDEANPPATAPNPTPVVPGEVERLAARAHGKDFATRSPYARMSRAKIVEPLPTEPVAYQTNQFDRQLRKRGIENLIYCGFCADLCLLRAPGGTETMRPFGYRLFLLRDATVGIEFPDWAAERVATRWAVRHFEVYHGQTLLTQEFIRACAGDG